MASKPSQTRSWFQTSQARRALAEKTGRETSNPAFNPAFSEILKKYNKDAIELTVAYTELQILAKEVLGNDLDEKNRKEVIDKLADFCLQIQSIDDDELYVLTTAGRKNALVALLQLERDLRENPAVNFESLKEDIKDRVKISYNLPFALRNESIRDETQIGTYFLYGMLPVLHNIDMGYNAVTTIYQAKQRAGIKLTKIEEEIYENYNSLTNGHIEIKTGFTAREIEKCFESFLKQSNEINQKVKDDSFISSKFKLSCDLVNTVIKHMHTKDVDYKNLHNQIKNEELKTLMECIGFCEQVLPDVNYDKLLKQVDNLSKDLSFACKMVLHSYGYKASGELGKYFDFYKIRLNGSYIDWGIEKNKSLLGSKSNAEKLSATTNDQIVETGKKITISENNALSLNEKTEGNPNKTLDVVENADVVNIDVAEGDQLKANGSVNNLKNSVKNVEKSQNNETSISNAVQGWLYQKIKQAYLSNKNTTEKMKAMFSNMTHEEQLELLMKNENKHFIDKVQKDVKQAIEKYETLSCEKKKEIDELSQGNDTLYEMLTEKKENIEQVTKQLEDSIRNRANIFKMQQRIEKKRNSNMSSDEKVRFDINNLICEIKYQTALGALTKNGKAFFESMLSSELDKQGISKVLTESDITTIKFETLYHFIQSASDVMLKEDVTPFLLTTEQVKETSEFKKVTSKYNNEEENITQFFQGMQNIK